MKIFPRKVNKVHGKIKKSFLKYDEMTEQKNQLPSQLETEQVGQFINLTFTVHIYGGKYLRITHMYYISLMDKLVYSKCFFGSSYFRIIFGTNS